MFASALAFVACSPVLSHMLVSKGGLVSDELPGTPTPAELVRRIRYSHQDHVVLVLHGGLVSTGDAVATANLVHPHLADVAFPVYVAWETGPAYALFPPPGPTRRPRAFRSDPSPEENAAIHPLGDAERRLEVNTRSVARSIWGRIKNWARVSNDPDNPNAAMNSFMREFVPLWRERNLKVSLVAHSAGAVYALHFLESLDRWHPGAKVDIVFLAPACTYASVDRRLDLWSRHVDRFRMFGLSDALERQDAVLRVQGLPRAWRGWYQASVLYYVSNNLEGPRDVPLLGMERFLALESRSTVDAPRELTDDERGAVRRVRETLRLSESAIWSEGPGTKRESLATGHLGFWTDSATMDSLRRFLSIGQ